MVFRYPEHPRLVIQPDYHFLALIFTVISEPDLRANPIIVTRNCALNKTTSPEGGHHICGCSGVDKFHLLGCEWASCEQMNMDNIQQIVKVLHACNRHT